MFFFRGGHVTPTFHNVETVTHKFGRLLKAPFCGFTLAEAETIDPHGQFRIQCIAAFERLVLEKLSNQSSY